MSSTMRDDVAPGKRGALGLKQGAKRDSVRGVFSRMARWLEVRRAREVVAAELYQMSPRELRDIGISYADIARILKTLS